MRHRILKEARRVVVKVGSRRVASKGMGLQTEWIERLAAQLAALKGNGREIVMVSYGAIVCGIEKLGLREYPKSLPMKQAAAPRPTGPMPPPARPAPMSAAPAKVTTTPTTDRAAELALRSMATSRMAATGATLAARRAGR